MSDADVDKLTVKLFKCAFKTLHAAKEKKKHLSLICFLEHIVAGLKALLLHYIHSCFRLLLRMLFVI